MNAVDLHGQSNTKGDISMTGTINIIQRVSERQENINGSLVPASSQLPPDMNIMVVVNHEMNCQLSSKIKI